MGIVTSLSLHCHFIAELGAKGAGEAGTAGAPAAVMNAINDALAPLGASVSTQPITPEVVLRALGRVC
jgi:carbon-monoxide dehydrogenase large subunit